MYSPALTCVNQQNDEVMAGNKRQQSGEPADHQTALGLSTGLAGSPISDLTEQKDGRKEEMEGVCKEDEQATET